MNNPTTFTKEQVDYGVSLVEDKLLGIIQDSPKASEAFRQIEESTYATNLEQPDGVLPDDSDEVSYDDLKNQYNSLMYKWAELGNSSEGDKLLEQMNLLEAQYPDINFMERSDNENMKYRQVAVEHFTSQQETDRIYYQNSQERAPATPQQVYDSFIPVDELSDRIIQQTEMLLKNPPPEYKKAVESAANDPKKLAKFQASEKLFFAKNTMECDGKTIEYKVVGQKVDWGRLISEDKGNPEYNLNKLRAFVTQSIRDYFGGFSRIKTIVVRSGYLIINGVCYSPMIDKQYLGNSDIFPIDTIEYIQNGLLAPLFDWKYLRSMKNLLLLDIDDTNFYIADVASDIGVGRRAGLITIFKYVPSLETFILGGEKVTPDTINSDEGKAVKQKISVFKHFRNFDDGYKFNVMSATNSFQSYTVNNFRNYANNRGDKGFFKFTTGVLGRGLLASVGVGVNGIAHLFKGTINTIKEVYKAGMTPVDINDVMN